MKEGTGTQWKAAKWWCLIRVSTVETEVEVEVDEEVVCGSAIEVEVVPEVEVWCDRPEEDAEPVCREMGGERERDTRLPPCLDLEEEDAAAEEVLLLLLERPLLRPPTGDTDRP